jgi:hypothetical protein
MFKPQYHQKKKFLRKSIMSGKAHTNNNKIVKQHKRNMTNHWKCQSSNSSGDIDPGTQLTQEAPGEVESGDPP